MAREATRGRTGVLLLNVGTPDAPRARDVRRYLRAFLGDPRVLDLSAAGRFLLLNAVILPFRPRRSAEAYRKVWGPEGSPLLVHGQAFAQALSTTLGPEHEVLLAMRYGRPGIAEALRRAREADCDRLVLFPLFPQYAAATRGTAVAEVFAQLAAGWDVPPIAVVPPFFDDRGTIEAMAAVGRPVLEALRPNHVLFSFHGLPERQIVRSDSTGSHCLRAAECCDRAVPANRLCYRAQAVGTARALAATLALPEGSWSLAFQSRLGRTPWIRPYTDLRVRELAQAGVKRLAVFSPAFVADCLETLEEIGIRAREDFLSAGGEELRLVPSLNAHPAWVAAAARLVRSASAALAC
jgi:ferrochelatase